MFVIVFLIAVLLLLGAVLSYAVVAPGSQLLGRTLFRGSAASSKIALTFDDGPGEATPRILETLQQHGVRATFFLCGENVERYPGLARRIAEDGHEIGNHTYSHPHLFGKTPGRIALEIRRAQDVITHRTGCRPKLFRPPYGERWFGLFPILSGKELSTVMWSVNSHDWRLPAARIARQVIRKTRPGSIILLHDGAPLREGGNRMETAAALGEIIGALREQYEFVTASEMG